MVLDSSVSVYGRDHMIKVQRYDGGGLRWHCDRCETGSAIRWINSPPPIFCRVCLSKMTAKEAAPVVLYYLYAKKIPIPNSVLKLGQLIRFAKFGDGTGLLPNGVSAMSLAVAIRDILDHNS